jgi:nicotinamidase-related amidase
MRRGPPDRDAALDPEATAVVVIDVQKGICNAQAAETRPWFHRTATEVAIPNMARLIAAARGAGAEVV